MRDVNPAIAVSIPSPKETVLTGRAKNLLFFRESCVQPQIIRCYKATEMLGISRATLHRRIKDGTLVKVQLSKNCSGITLESINRVLSGEAGIGESPQAKNLAESRARRLAAGEAEGKSEE